MLTKIPSAVQILICFHIQNTQKNNKKIVVVKRSLNGPRGLYEFFDGLKRPAKKINDGHLGHSNYIYN